MEKALEEAIQRTDKALTEKTSTHPIIHRVHVIKDVIFVLQIRKGFYVIASGMVSNAEDTAKLIALGANGVSIGTAALIALGCIMCHSCHIGACPMAIASE